jgi:predicted amidophosphoribosyltransferase
MTVDMTTDLTTNMTNTEFNNLIKQGVCPYCGSKMQPDGGCMFCPACGYSLCG